MKPELKINKFFAFFQSIKPRKKDHIIPSIPHQDGVPSGKASNKRKLIIFLIVLIILAVAFLILKLALFKKEQEYYLPVNISEERQSELEENIAKDLEMLKLFPKDYNVYMDLGNLERSLGNASKAIEYFKKAWEIIPANSTPWLNIGNVYIRLGMYKEAEEAFLKARDVNGSYYLVYFNLAKLYNDFLKDKSDQVRTVYLEGLKNTNNDYQLLQPFTSYLVEVKNYSEALQYLEVLYNKIPQENKQSVLDKIEEVKGLMEQTTSL